MLPYNQILIVEDNDIDCYIAQVMLKKAGFTGTIDSASNGEQALDYMAQRCAHNQAPQLILLDVNMPLMDGFDFFIHCQQRHYLQQTKVVLLTSSVSRHDQMKAQELGIEHFVKKPLTPEKLAVLLQQIEHTTA